MICEKGKIRCRELEGLCGGGNRTWYGRYSDPEENVVFKINCVGAVP